MELSFAKSALYDPTGFFPEIVRAEARRTINEKGTEEDKKDLAKEKPFIRDNPKGLLSQIEN